MTPAGERIFVQSRLNRILGFERQGIEFLRRRWRKNNCLHKNYRNI